MIKYVDFEEMAILERMEDVLEHVEKTVKVDKPLALKMIMHLISKHSLSLKVLGYSAICRILLEEYV